MANSFSGGRSRREPPDHGQVTGKLYHLRVRVECTRFWIFGIVCNNLSHGIVCNNVSRGLIIFNVNPVTKLVLL